MNKKHTPEPWTATSRVISNIAARRIVACVNACKNLSDNDLEGLITFGGLTLDRLNVLTAQRDELLAVLKEVVYCSEHFGKAYAGRDARDRAKALIKRIENA